MNAELEACVQKNGQDDRLRRILFVCTGNTCRSPMAAALCNDMRRPREVCSACVDEDLDGSLGVATSAGLYVSEGAPISPEAVATLREGGVALTPENDYASHTARGVTRAMMEEANMVVGITAAHAMELTLRFPEFAGKIVTMPMDISDPFGQGMNAYRACLMQLRYSLHLLCKGEK